MEIFRMTIKVLTVASLGLAAIQVYLTVNKIWKRKHERAVAEAISLMGEFVGLIPLLLLTTNFMIEGQWEGVIDGALWIASASVAIAIGTGMWVEGKRGRGFWTLLKESIRLERGEVGDLAKSFFRPSGAEKIIKILGQVALIDEKLDDRERHFIQGFADSWGIRFAPDEIARERSAGHINYINLRDDVADYLATSPPPAQVTQLSDVLNSLVKIDEEVSTEEQLMLAELDGMMTHYLDEDYEAETYAVAVVPQDPAQDEAIGALLPGVRKREVEGGKAYVTGRYHSQRYAEIVGEQYRKLNFFTTVVRAE